MCWTDTFWTNPEYRVTVIDADEDDADNTGTLIIALLQKDRRRQGQKLLPIGYAVFQVTVRVRFPCTATYSVLSRGFVFRDAFQCDTGRISSLRYTEGKSMCTVCSFTEVVVR